MKPEAVFFGMVVVAPIVCHFFARAPLARMGLSVAVSVVLMSVCLVVGEARASVPDYDIVFGIALILWNGAAVIYAISASLALSAIARLIRCIKEHKGALNHER